MEFIVTSSNFVAKYKDDKLVRTISSGKGIYFGISKNENEIFVVSRQSSGAIIQDGENIVQVYDIKNLELLKTKVLKGVRDVHGCSVYKNKLYVCNTFFNQIEVYDCGSLDHIDSINFTNTKNDVNHINDVAIAGNYLATTQHHTHHNDNNCVLNLVDLESSKIKKGFPLGKKVFAHSSVKYNNCVYCLDSINGKIFKVNTSSLKMFSMGSFPMKGFIARGISFIDEDNVLIGYSFNSSRMGRHNLIDGKVRFINLSTKKILKEFNIEKSGQVCDIMFLNM